MALASCCCWGSRLLQLLRGSVRLCLRAVPPHHQLAVRPGRGHVLVLPPCHRQRPDPVLVLIECVHALAGACAPQLHQPVSSRR